MKRLTSILAMNHDGVIGVGNTLPWRLRSDLAFFKAETSETAVIMGRRTYDSLNGKPLPNRFNIVLSHNPRFGGMERDDLRFAFSVEEGLLVADQYKAAKEDCYIVGGATMYEQFSPYVERYVITLVDKKIPHGDTLIPLEMFGDPNEWEINLRDTFSATPPHDEVPFSIVELQNRRPLEIKRRRKAAIESYKARSIHNGRTSFRLNRESGPTEPIWTSPAMI